MAEEKVGALTNKSTQAGRDVYETSEGEMVSEKSTTFQYKGKWINVPTIHNGYQYEDDVLIMMLDEGIIEPTSVHDSLPDALSVAEQRSEGLKFNRGGTAMQEQMELFKQGGFKDEGGMVDEESGNKVPVGGTRKGVRDDIPANISEGEFIFPEDVTRYIGLSKLMELRQEAKMGLKKMEAMGQMGNSDEATIDDDLPFTMVDLIIMGDDEEDEGSKKEISMAPGGLLTGETNVTRTLPSTPLVNTTPTNTTPVTTTRSLTPNIERAARTTPDFKKIMGESNVEYIEYRNSAGNSIIIPHVGGVPTMSIPDGYTVYTGEDVIGSGTTEVDNIVSDTNQATSSNRDDNYTSPPAPDPVDWAGLTTEELIQKSSELTGFGRTLANGALLFMGPAGMLGSFFMKHQDRKVAEQIASRLAAGGLSSAEVTRLTKIRDSLVASGASGIFGRAIDYVGGLLGKSAEDISSAQFTADKVVDSSKLAIFDEDTKKIIIPDEIKVLLKSKTDAVSDAETQTNKALAEAEITAEERDAAVKETGVLAKRAELVEKELEVSLKTASAAALAEKAALADSDLAKSKLKDSIAEIAAFEKKAIDARDDADKAKETADAAVKAKEAAVKEVEAALKVASAAVLSEKAAIADSDLAKSKLKDSVTEIAAFEKKATDARKEADDFEKAAEEAKTIAAEAVKEVEAANTKIIAAEKLAASALASQKRAEAEALASSAEAGSSAEIAAQALEDAEKARAAEKVAQEESLASSTAAALAKKDYTAAVKAKEAAEAETIAAKAEAESSAEVAAQARIDADSAKVVADTALKDFEAAEARTLVAEKEKLAAEWLSIAAQAETNAAEAEAKYSAEDAALAREDAEYANKLAAEYKEEVATVKEEAEAARIEYVNTAGTITNGTGQLDEMDTYREDANSLLPIGDGITQAPDKTFRDADNVAVNTLTGNVTEMPYTDEYVESTGVSTVAPTFVTPVETGLEEFERLENEKRLATTESQTDDAFSISAENAALEKKYQETLAGSNAALDSAQKVTTEADSFLDDPSGGDYAVTGEQIAYSGSGTQGGKQTLDPREILPTSEQVALDAGPSETISAFEKHVGTTATGKKVYTTKYASTLPELSNTNYNSIEDAQAAEKEILEKITKETTTSAQTKDVFDPYIVDVDTTPKVGSGNIFPEAKSPDDFTSSGVAAQTSVEQLTTPTVVDTTVDPNAGLTKNSFGEYGRPDGTDVEDSYKLEMMDGQNVYDAYVKPDQPFVPSTTSVTPDVTAQTDEAFGTTSNAVQTVIPSETILAETTADSIRNKDPGGALYDEFGDIVKETFGDAFSRNQSAGKSTFTYEGNLYTTENAAKATSSVENNNVVDQGRKESDIQEDINAALKLATTNGQVDWTNENVNKLLVEREKIRLGESSSASSAATEAETLKKLQEAGASSTSGSEKREQDRLNRLGSEAEALKTKLDRGTATETERQRVLQLSNSGVGYIFENYTEPNRDNKGDRDGTFKFRNT